MTAFEVKSKVDANGILYLSILLEFQKQIERSG